MAFIKIKKKPKVSNELSPLELNYYEDGTLIIPKKTEKLIKESIKQSKLKELELLDYSIRNLQNQYLIMNKLLTESSQSFEQNKQNYIESIKREINPELLCQICYENRVDTVLIPCGHTWCSNCIKPTDRCYICRQYIEKTHTIFFG